MKLNGIIFDFNGTMFQDSHLHEQAWIDMIQKYNPGNGLTETEILKNVHGRTNDKILRHFVSSELTDEEVEKLSLEKEEHYRKLCLNKPEQLVLTDGLIEVLDELKERKLPLTIATATIKENVDFYFDTFALDRWFDPDKVVFDDGSFPGKPEPDIFLHAARKLGVLSRRMSGHRGRLFRTPRGQQREHRHDHRNRPVLQEPGNLPEGKSLQGWRHHGLPWLHATPFRGASLN